jgi:hypothetical protein
MKKMNKHLIIILITSFLFSCYSNNESLLKQYVIAHNSHNINKSLEIYSEDISFELVGTWIKQGKDEIKKLEEWDAAVNSQLQFNALRESGDTLFCNGIEINDWFTAIGIEKITYDSIIFIFEEQLIKKIIAKPSSEINQKIGRAMGSIIDYTSKTNNNILSELIPNGEFVYSKENAEKWINLLEMWQKKSMHHRDY